MIDLHIRIPDELANSLKVMAAKNLRSMNSEVLAAIRSAVEKWSQDYLASQNENIVK